MRFINADMQNVESVNVRIVDLNATATKLAGAAGQPTEGLSRYVCVIVDDTDGLVSGDTSVSAIAKYVMLDFDTCVRAFSMGKLNILTNTEESNIPVIVKPFNVPLVPISTDSLGVEDLIKIDFGLSGTLNLLHLTGLPETGEIYVIDKPGITVHEYLDGHGTKKEFLDLGSLESGSSLFNKPPTSDERR